MSDDRQLSEDAALFALMASALAERSEHHRRRHYTYDEFVSHGLADAAHMWPSNAEAVDALKPIARRLVELVRAPLLAEVAAAKKEVDVMYRLEQEARHDSAESFRVVVGLDEELKKVRIALAETRKRGALLAEWTEKFLDAVVKEVPRGMAYVLVSSIEVVKAKLLYWKVLPAEGSDGG